MKPMLYTCISTDNVNITLGHLTYATVAYEVTVDHAGFARGVTARFLRAKNSKMIIRYDGAIQKLRASSTYRQLEYNLEEDRQELLPRVWSLCPCRWGLPQDDGEYVTVGSRL
ncbi:unnamed protein product [Choristocarpus tenellus]